MSVLETAPAGYAKVNLRFGPYSSSKLNAARCPARFEGRYIKRDRVIADRIAAARGTAIHWVLEQIAKRRIAKEDIKPTDIDEWISQSIGANPAAYAQIDLVREAVSAYLRKPSPYLDATSLVEVGLAVALYQEETFVDDAVPGRAWVKVPYVDPYAEAQAPTPPELQAFFCCKIDELTFDHINKVITICDHKTTPSASVNADVAFQLGCYAWMVSIHYPGWTIRTSVHYAHPMLNFYSAPEEWPTEALQDIESGVLTRVRTVESFAEYPALPGSNCDYCHMATHCPELKALERQNAANEVDLNINNVDDLQRVARRVRMLGVAYDRHNDVLKEGIEKLCPKSGIAVDGMIYEFRASDSVDWKATDRRIREEARKAEAELASTPEHPNAAWLKMLTEVKTLDGLLEKFGINPNLLKNYGSDHMKGLWKLNKPELIKALQLLVCLEKKTRFGGYKS